MTGQVKVGQRHVLAKIRQGLSLPDLAAANKKRVKRWNSRRRLLVCPSFICRVTRAPGKRSRHLTQTQLIIMKKFVVALLALSVASLSYADSGCGGCKSEKKSEQKTEQKAE